MDSDANFTFTRQAQVLPADSPRSPNGLTSQACYPVPPDAKDSLTRFQRWQSLTGAKISGSPGCLSPSAYLLDNKLSGDNDIFDQWLHATERAVAASPLGCVSRTCGSFDNNQNGLAKEGSARQLWVPQNTEQDTQACTSPVVTDRGQRHWHLRALHTHQTDKGSSDDEHDATSYSNSVENNNDAADDAVDFAFAATPTSRSGNHMISPATAYITQCLEAVSFEEDHMAVSPLQSSDMVAKTPGTCTPATGTTALHTGLHGGVYGQRLRTPSTPRTPIERVLELMIGPGTEDHASCLPQQRLFTESDDINGGALQLGGLCEIAERATANEVNGFISSDDECDAALLDAITPQRLTGQVDSMVDSTYNCISDVIDFMLITPNDS